MKSKKTLVSYVELDEEDLAKLREYAEVYTPSSRGFEDAKGEAEIALSVVLQPGEVKKLKRLEFLQTISAGVDSLPWSMIPEKVVVCGNMGSNADAVAEHAWALLLAAAKRLHHYMPNVKNGDFSQKTETLQLRGRTLCVVGMGSIGRKVAEVGKAFGMRVIGVTRSGSSSIEVDRVVGPEGLDEALRESDFVVLSAPLTKHTRGLIGLNRLRMLKKRCVLVNIGRAELVDREALLTYLRENPEAVVATDVWWNVKLGDKWETELINYPNFIGTPWVAGGFGSPEIFSRMKQAAVENIIRYLSGQKPINIVDRSDYV
ncbi:MAG: 2-hydroxyacid dehydrogenase [Candidatus Caldarchaeum sp.]|nr:2-hydroxyacid dehydrogenase [Candidatus Caldarchaeum sp.]